MTHKLDIHIERFISEMSCALEEKKNFDADCFFILSQRNYQEALRELNNFKNIYNEYKESTHV